MEEKNKTTRRWRSKGRIVEFAEEKEDEVDEKQEEEEEIKEDVAVHEEE